MFTTKKTTALLICLISMSALLSQTPVADSLKSLLVAHANEDTDRVNLLNNLAYELRRAKPEAADSLINLAITLADRIGYPKGKGYALAMQGSRYYAKLKYKEADSVFVLSKQSLESVNDAKDLAYMFRSWANMEMDEGNHAKSLDYFLQGLKKAQEAGDIKQVV